MMDEREDRLDELIRDAARDYNAPPVPPRAQMWDAIQAGRRAAETRVHPIAARRPLRLGIGIAALLALGIAIGRLSVPDSESAVTGSSTVAVSPPESARPVLSRPTPGNERVTGTAPTPEESSPQSSVASRLVTGEHLTQVESFLTEFGTRPESGDYTADAQDLLTDTRLLLDSKRVSDPRIQRLLEDLELVLTQIAALSRDRSEDLDLIADAVAQRQLRTRLRSVLPTGPAIRS